MFNFNFFSNEPINNSVTRTLNENPDAPLEKILSDSDLSSSIRAEIPQLIDYITRPDILKRLLKWALTREFSDYENSDRLARASVLILSSLSKALQERLQDDQIFIRALQDAKENHIENDLQLCGHFQRILEIYVRCTNGGFLQYFPNLTDFLIQNCHVLALRELLLKLMTDFSEAYPEEQYENITYDLARASNSDNGYFVITVMRDIMKDKKSTINMFQSERVVKELLNTATNPQPNLQFPLFEAEIFKVIEGIAKGCVITDHIIAEYAKKYTFDENNITCGTVAALRIFKDGLNVLMPRFFVQPYITILNEILFDKICDMFDRQLASVVEKFNLPQKIMETFDTNQVNGHITELAVYLTKKTNISKALQTTEWLDFVETKVKPRDAQRQVNIVENEPPPAPEEPSSLKKTGVTPTASFGGFLGGISSFKKLAQLEIDEKKKEAAKQSKIQQEQPAPTFTLSDLTGGGNVSSSSGGLSSSSGSIGGFSLKGLSSGHSFTIPTVYQADPIQTAMVC